MAHRPESHETHKKWDRAQCIGAVIGFFVSFWIYERSLRHMHSAPNCMTESIMPFINFALGGVFIIAGTGLGWIAVYAGWVIARLGRSIAADLSRPADDENTLYKW